jgi:uncharacterized membrane protein YbhN (UPF0104 family)
MIGAGVREISGRAASEPERAARPYGNLPLKMLLGVAVAAAVVVLGVLDRTAVDAGGDILAGADGDWLALAALATVAMWTAGTASLLGTLPARPPLGRLVAVQFAASFANHLLPAGSGAMAVNVRFLQRQGVSRGVAMGAVGLNSLATGITHIVLLAAIVVADPAALHRAGVRLPRPGGWSPSAGPATAIAVGALGALAVTALAPGPPRRWLRRRAVRLAAALRRMTGEARELGAVLRHPGRAAALWLGSLSLPVCHALVLFSVLRGLQAPLGIWTVLVVYLGVSSLSAVIPSPGAIGGLDVALVAALAAEGISSAVAVGAVLGYRMITVWLPLPPAACTFAVLLRRRII